MSPAPEATGSSTQQRLRSLVVANRAMVAELSLDNLLRLIVESARTVVEAEYAVLEVIGPGGGLEQFIQSGADLRSGSGPAADEPSESLSEVLPPQSRLPLRQLFSDQVAPVPGAALPVRSLLGVPVQTGETVHGNLFLANRVGGGGFSDEDESLVTALAATAGIAFENARLYEESHRRQQWLTASAEISQRLLAGEVTLQEVLDEIAETVRRLAPADHVSIVRTDPREPEMLVVAATCGEGAEEARNLRYHVAGSIAWQAIQGGRGVLARNRQAESSGIYQRVRHFLHASDVMALPLQGIEGASGAIIAVRTNPVAFTDVDVEMAEGFASQAALALELADSRREHHQLAVLEDRARIARDLHDHVVQKLFAVGLTLQGAMGRVKDPVVGTRLGTTVQHLDETIRSIRSSIFELQTPRTPTTSFRGRLLSVVAELAPVLGFTPSLDVEGPVETRVNEAVLEEIEGLLREVMANIALHADATAASVRLSTDGRRLTVTVSDNGSGLPAGAPLSGLARLRERVEELDGRLELAASPDGGLLVSWTIPI